MKVITLVRHGQTAENKAHTVQGNDPCLGKLNETGMQQAHLLGKKLLAITLTLS